MNTDLTKRQRLRFFLINCSAFAIIFLLLGVITITLLNQSAYSQTDESLVRMSRDTKTIDLEIKRYEQKNPFLFQRNGDNQPMDNRFNTQIILWSKDGRILNKYSLGAKFTPINDLTLNTEDVDKVHAFSLKNQDSETLNFHSYLIKASSLDNQVAYVQFITNTNPIQSSLENFKMILIIGLIVFWLLSIGLSYYLSKYNMKPVLKSWRKQQEFVENASHELRTPLTIIQNNLEHLFTKPNDKVIDQADSIAQSLNEARRLKSLTSDLLTLARSDTNELTLFKKPTATHEFIAKLTQPFIEMAELGDKSFHVLSNEELIVNFDVKKIHQVIVILLDNALKYTKAGDSITVSSIKQGNFWQLTIQNTGPSIDLESLPYLFDRFYRQDDARSKETGGYGLGLAIAQQIVKDHAGTIKVENIKPQGVKFSVKIPID
ncbi:sensor histidine kinase [Holzapfeliella floricola]|uniref:sensor histidine kinase n=1 Tax=Holzapfeliella floricola TaxID=679249 RepID=UPI00078172CD|nr:HAMP domain-containing sensor histidine kinase [Holzapfeliella floricola]